MDSSLRCLAKMSLSAFVFCLPLAGCEPQPKDCGLVDKTEEQCRQELTERGVYCRGVLERVEYVTVERYRTEGTIQTLLRFRDGSSCLTDASFDPLSVNGIAAGTAVRVVWSRLPVEMHGCFSRGSDNHKIFKDVCAYVQTIETGNAEADPR